MRNFLNGYDTRDPYETCEILREKTQGRRHYTEPVMGAVVGREGGIYWGDTGKRVSLKFLHRKQ